MYSSKMIFAALFVIAGATSLATAQSDASAEGTQRNAAESGPPVSPKRALGRSLERERKSDVGTSTLIQTGMPIGPTPTGTLGTAPEPGKAPIGVTNDSKAPIGGSPMASHK